MSRTTLRNTSKLLSLLSSSALLVLALSACEGGFVGGGGECQGPGCEPGPGKSGGDPWSQGTPGQPGQPGQPGGGSAPPLPPSCTADAECTSPYVCHLATGKCVPPSAKDAGTCDPIEGIGCTAPLDCINGICMTPPGTCQDNDQCPAGFICSNGMCKPDPNGGAPGGGAPGCLDNNQCPAGQVCVAGQCKPQAVCNIPHSPTRLGGTWELDSQLKVRDGLEGLTKGILSLASTLQDIVDGKFAIKGVPSVFSSLIGGIVKSLIDQYVPPWGTDLIKWLSNVDDAIDTWRVVSLDVLQPLGNDQYIANTKWTLVEFEYEGAKVSASPANVPGLGEITVNGYSAREVCGTMILDKHKVNNKFGKIFRWAIEALLTTISCSKSNIPCYTTLDQMFNDLIDCQKLGQAVASADSTIPGISSLVASACVAEKQNLIQLLLKELDDLAAKMTYMSLSAKADIANNNVQLLNGRWYGVLGGSYGKGNFEGSFTGSKK